MGQALYRLHRPKKLSEVEGQDHITASLERALKNKSISHAYLFTGPRGVGKTTVARILAHEINGFDYQDDANHLDIIEIDAASNRRIDEIRDLRDKVFIAPTTGKYKVYIIDEVHMLTKEAFNALLKTLEEPPEHAVFILATTETHKLPETIISRTQRYSFKPIDQKTAISHLKYLAAQEKIAIDDDALKLIADHGEGSFRDSISLLDQLRNVSDKVTMDDVRSVLGIAPEDLIKDIIDSVRTHNPSKLIGLLETAVTRGLESSKMAAQIATLLRLEIISSQLTMPKDLLLNLLSALIDVPASNDPKSKLEIALLDAALSGDGPQPELLQSPKPAKSSPAPEAPASQKPTPKPEQPNDKDQSEAPKNIDKTTTLDPQNWDKVLAALKQKHNTLYSVVQAAKPAFSPGLVTLESPYPFHQKKLNEKSSKKIITEIIESASGHRLNVISVVVSKNDTPGPSIETEKVIEISPSDPDQPKQSETQEVKAINDIFGGAEVLAS